MNRILKQVALIQRSLEETERLTKEYTQVREFPGEEWFRDFYANIQDGRQNLKGVRQWVKSMEKVLDRQMKQNNEFMDEIVAERKKR